MELLLRRARERIILMEERLIEIHDMEVYVDVAEKDGFQLRC